MPIATLDQPLTGLVVCGIDGRPGYTKARTSNIYDVLREKPLICTHLLQCYVQKFYNTNPCFALKNLAPVPKASKFLRFTVKFDSRHQARPELLAPKESRSRPAQHRMLNMQNLERLMNLDELKFIINHVFLPPKLPDKADDKDSLADMNFALLSQILESAIKYQHRLVGPSSEKWAVAVRMLSNICKLQGESGLSKGELSSAIDLMRPGDVITLHIAAQNAGIILRHLGTEVLFLSFEASPTSVEVMSNSGKLLCSYPGPAIAVPISKVKDPSFRDEFASFAKQMDSIILHDAVPVSTKAGSKVPEERDTMHPKFITEMLTGILRGIGRPVDDVVRFRKRIADEVLWNDARLPWRRSPLWLVVRVALQMISTEYKPFMVFFFADILELAVGKGLGSDLLFVMNAKLSRRAYKLDSNIPQFVLSRALEVTTTNNRCLDDRWARIQQSHSRPLGWAPRKLSFERDSYLSLSKSGQYLAGVMNRKTTALQASKFKATHPARNPVNGASENLPSRNLVNASKDERYTLLADFELWVQENLDLWVRGNIYREKACGELSRWIDDYAATSKLAYLSNPENTSIMLLTIFELWVAMDKVAVHHYPLLLEYDPELAGSDKLFDPLLLPRYHQMERLHRVETYLEKRHMKANSSNGSVFTSNSFAVRYFEQSVHHQELEKRIEGDAQRDKQRKIEEFHSSEGKYNSLISEASEQSCTSYRDYRGKHRHPHCNKCINIKKAGKMRIGVYEWPLPRDRIKRIAVVFELECPIGFSVWRDTTYKILVDICTPVNVKQQDSNSEKPFEQLWDYAGLKKYYSSRGQRLAWSSKRKSFLRSHYSDRSFPTSVNTICVDNALEYELFDKETSRWATKNLGKFDVRKVCTFLLPEGPYQSLQYAVRDTTHTSNLVISKQANCPIELSLHEYDSFCTLRAGHRLQWLNIARELRANILTYSHPAVNALFMQAAWQVGPSSPTTIYRECHTDLERLEFGKTLLGELERMLTSIEANWLESISAKTLIELTARLLSTNKHASITRDAVSLLHRARKVTLNWTRQLVEKLQKCVIEESMKDLQLRVLQMAAICRATYDVDAADDHLDSILSSTEDVAVLIECAIIVHDNTPACTDSLPQLVCQILDRDRRLSHTLERYLREQLPQATLSEGLNQSTQQPNCMSGSLWDSLPKPVGGWMVSKKKMAGDNLQEVHYNLLSGELLVDGSPVGRMPSDFVSHPTYRRLFGEKILDVFPSSMCGMRYRTKHNISGFQIHFSKLGDELIVRYESGNGEIYELIPHTKISGDFPVHFVEEYVHWLSIETGVIEFRPMGCPWEKQTEKNWRVSYSQTGYSSMHRGGERMLDVREALTISSIFKPLEDPKFIDISFTPKDGLGSVSVRLPRLKLEFFVNRDENLECRQFRGAIVDTNQNIGALSGLVNRLVLRQNDVRIIIVPDGEVNFSTHENHVKVHIDTGSLTDVRYYSYTVDGRLGRLVGNGSLASHLYKIYLHAVTAHCLADPLTNRTGTEEALENLRSAATWSFQRLLPKEVEILRLIASLTPTRVYYPAHREVMQKVNWKPIPIVMQHDEFHMTVMEIFAHATKFHVFREDSEPKGTQDTDYYKSKSDPKLLARAAIRNAVYRKDEFGGSLLETVHDTLYVARDSKINESKETQVCSIAKAVECWRPNIDVSRQLIHVLEKWQQLGGAGDDKKIPLGYDHKWTKPNLAAVWSSIYDTCRKSEKSRDMYQMIFFLSTLSYSGKVELEVIGSLLAFATIPQFRHHAPPKYPSYNLAKKYAPDETQLKRSVNSHTVSFELSQESRLVARSRETETGLWHRQQSTYAENLGLQSERFVAKLISQWPCAVPSTPSDMDYQLIDSSGAMGKIRPMFDDWYRNKTFREHISDVQHVLDSIHPVKPITQKYLFQPSNADQHRVQGKISFKDLLLRDAPSIPRSLVGAISVAPTSVPSRREAIPRAGGNSLKMLLCGFKAAHIRKFEERYADGLLKSFDALEKQSLSAETHLELPSRSDLELALTQCESDLAKAFQMIQDTLAPLREVDRLMKITGLWPCLSPISLLRRLSADVLAELSNSWKYALVSYGKKITQVQRFERLLACDRSEREKEFRSEIQNIGHQEWDPVVHPDWLLIEIENNFLVRQVQNQIASEMIKPTSGKNQTLQLNMGEGKSSVIVPIVSAALADGNRLVRVVVLKPLSTQMFRLLVQKLCGLTNRRIFHMPFSRSVKLDKAKAIQIRDLYKECMRVGGVLLAQPEHILSFKLIGLEMLYKKDTELARALLDAQHWLEGHTHDLLDECDEILQPKNELIYTIGNQQPLESSPDRWKTVQEIFSLVKRCVAAISRNFPQGLEVEMGLEEKRKTGCFPIIRILEPDAGKELLSQVASDILKGLLPAVSFRLFPAKIRDLASHFITDPNMTLEKAQPLLDYCGNDTSMTSLLLLRGLIAENIIFFALKEKRWRVDYGLTPHRVPRTSLAVPFRAKDVPAPRAEFSHPDVAITLTCLSYYYTGLSDNQLEDCFKILLRLSNPVVQYEEWIHDLGGAVPETLLELSGINLLDNEERTNTIFPLFRYNKSVIDFYLSQAIFPKEAKEFPYKLTSSGWDIGQAKTHPTTGFSGTNDSRDLLPLSVTQYESLGQLYTNAKVLSYLLQSENSYVCAKHDSGGRLDVGQLLGMLVKQKPPIRVLLDVGAQVLELENSGVAAEWLTLVPKSEAQAVVFFENDELTVLSRDGSKESYEISIFAKQMDQCLVYLDEVHTRGTDLKLPTKTRAAVTLGPSLTKDRLVQACMRMRMLGHGQSVLFCAPPEIERKILDARSNGLDPVNVSDVLHWCMAEACISNRNNAPIWAKQGTSYQSRHLAYRDIQSSGVFPSSLCEQEAQTLRERFGVRESSNDFLSGPIPPELERRRTEMESIREKCALFDVGSIRGAHAQEEQERELSYEVEVEQQVERPPLQEPFAHRIHPDVINYIKQGIIQGTSTGFTTAFKSLLTTSAKDHHENVWSPSLLATTDFVKTIKTTPKSKTDEFIRPVRWLLSANAREQLLIMSPYEVNELIPLIRSLGSVNLHIYSPKVTKGMRSFLDDWESWATSPIMHQLSGSLVDELNIFAGQLYLNDYHAYEELSGFLGLYLGELPADKDVAIHSDGFVERVSRMDLGMGASPFSKSPVVFLRRLMGFRRKDQDYLATHLGQVLYGRLLTEHDFDDITEQE